MQSANQLVSFFKLASFEITLSIYVVILTATIGLFAARYLAFNNKKHSMIMSFGIIAVSSVVMLCSDNMFVFLATLALGNFTLVHTMMHKRSWQAAKATGYKAASVLIAAFAMLSLALFLLNYQYGTASIQALNQKNTTSWLAYFAVVLIVLGAMAQSAIWPFHRWLLSSLNAPTPVSAIMHAGLINGGGIILIKFSSLLTSTPNILWIILLVGMLSAVQGSLWRLIQSDVKSALACSTVAQMGFMFMQCGMGLFAAAAAHICLHGLFKSYMFLGHADIALKEKPQDNCPPSSITMVLAIPFALLAGCLFAFIKGSFFNYTDTNLLLNLVATLFFMDFALTWIRNEPSNFLKIGVSTILLGAFYASVIFVFETTLLPSQLTLAQDLTVMHLVCAAGLVIIWFGHLWFPIVARAMKLNLKKYYVRLLNASQPYPCTVTSIRNTYQF